MTCDEVRELLSLFAGGDLSDEQRAEAEGHVARCEPCARGLDEYREARARLALLRGEKEPPTAWRLWNDVRDRLFPRRSSRLLDEALRFAAIFLAGLAIGTAVHVYGRSLREEPVAPAEVAGEPGAREKAVPAAARMDRDF